MQAEVEKLMESVAECLNRLKAIALKPDLSSQEDINMLIEEEITEAKPGWKQRVQHLISMGKQAETMVKMERGEKLLQSPQ